MWVHGEVTIYDRNTYRKIHEFTVRTEIMEVSDEWETCNEAAKLWKKMFEAYGEVDIDDIWTD